MKNDEIKALENFVAELKKIDDIDGLYFNTIVKFRAIIASNIKNDFDWNTGLYYTKKVADDSADKMMDQIAALKLQVIEQKAVVKDMKQYDVREIKRSVRNLQLDITSQTDHLSRTKKMLQSNIEMLEVN